MLIVELRAKNLLFLSNKMTAMGASRNVGYRPIADIRCAWQLPTMRLSFIILLPLGLALCSCGGEWERIAELSSPDGSMKAVIEYKNLGSCCSDYTRVSLANAEGGTLLEPGVVVEGANAGNQRARWVNNDLLVIEMCSATRIEARSRTFREQMTKPDGGEDAVRVEVVTLPNSERNGVAYCPVTAGR